MNWRNLRRWLSMVMLAAALVACGGGDDGEEPQPKPEPTPTPNPTPNPDPNPDLPLVNPEFFSNGFMKGSTMSFASFLEDYGMQYREGGKETDPYLSMKNHGANIVRLQLNYEAFPKFEGQTIDWADYKAVVKDAKRAKSNQMDLLLTLKPDADSYTESTTHHNIVPAAWAALSETELGDKLYEWVYTTLVKLAEEEIYPRVVAVGNEVNIGFLKPSASAASDGARTGRLLKRGFEAVRAYAAKYNPHVKTMLHIADPSKIHSYAKAIVGAGGSDFDLIGVSWYPGTNIGHKLGSFQSIRQMAQICKSDYQAEAVILETAYSFTTGNNAAGQWMGDWCQNAYNYPDWNDAENAVNYTPAKQRAWLKALAEELKAGGGAGVITWGTESLSDVITDTAGSRQYGFYTYPAAWANGSTWENNSYWDFTNQNNLHEGIDWMKDVAE
ncbi:MAG: glycosyl hydrolase 53 family protein [Alistipes sp.]|nr:glycosyl hydrolase 53 family protein [Alistipes sp.]